jgi:hypothetical protein
MSEFQELTTFFERSLTELTALKAAQRLKMREDLREEISERVDALEGYLKWLKEVMETEGLIH